MLSVSRWSSLGACAAVLAGLGTAVGGCNESGKANPAPSTVVSAERAMAQTVLEERAPKPAGPAPQDLDVAALSRKLGCGGSAKAKDACRVLEEFSQAGRWVWPERSSEGRQAGQLPEARWAGNAFIVGKADTDSKNKRVMVLYGKQIPTMQAGPDMLPIKLGAALLSDRLGPALSKLVDGISRMSKVPRKNAALKAAVGFTPETQRSVQATDGASLLWVADDKAYFRQQGRKTLVVELSADATDQKGEGTYAELWPVYW